MEHGDRAMTTPDRTQAPDREHETKIKNAVIEQINMSVTKVTVFESLHDYNSARHVATVELRGWISVFCDHVDASDSYLNPDESVDIDSDDLLIPFAESLATESDIAVVRHAMLVYKNQLYYDGSTQRDLLTEALEHASYRFDAWLAFR